MMEFGNTLRAAREAKGLSIAQLADATHLLPRVVEALEKEDFSHLPAPIYGRGFVKLYCEQVDLDPKPMIAEFMDILNGKRDIDIKPRQVTPDARTTIASPITPDTPQGTTSGLTERPPSDDLFSLSTPAPAPAPIVPAPSSTPKTTSRYASDYDKLIADGSSINWMPSPSIWRLAVVCIVATAFAVAIAFGIRALYHATSSTPEPMDETTAAALKEISRTSSAAQDTARQLDEKTRLANEQRTPIEIPPFYNN